MELEADETVARRLGPEVIESMLQLNEAQRVHRERY